MVGLKTDGTLWNWGNNWNGELGDGTNVAKSVPTKLGNDANWSTITINSSTVLALKQNGTLWAWGENETGTLGDGTTTDRNTITQIGTDTDWQSVSAGSNTSYGIKNNGTLWAWGDGGLGELGNGGLVFGEAGFNNDNFSYTPIQIGTESNWQTVNAGTGHVVALKTNGTLWAWGYNAYGQVGDGTGNGGVLNIKKYPIQIGIDNDWQYIDCAFRSSFAIKTNGTLWAWGINAYGQLGQGNLTAFSSPKQVGTLTTWTRTTQSGYSNYGIAVT